MKRTVGSALRVVPAKVAAASVSGTFWGAVVKRLVQSSSATTMTTIGLVSTGLLSFPRGLSLVSGASIGMTGTGWLVALVVVRISLAPYALPIVFAVDGLACYSDELAGPSVEHRRTMLDSVAAGGLTASDAIAHVDAIRRVHHAWRATAHFAAAVA